MKEMSYESVLAVERQRILADLHDGLGASLVGLLQYVKSGQADAASIERRVREALLEMRIAIDALRPNDGHLDVVLANLRYRLDDTIRGAGMRLVWDVAALPPICGLDASSVFSIQRIVVEAVTNALKHSGAARMRVSACALRDGDVAVSISDDGRGFEPSQSSTGIGLSSMHARARRIGAVVDVMSHPGVGTEVRLTIPNLPLRAPLP